MYVLAAKCLVADVDLRLARASIAMAVPVPAGIQTAARDVRRVGVDGRKDVAAFAPVYIDRRLELEVALVCVGCLDSGVVDDGADLLVRQPRDGAVLLGLGNGEEEGEKKKRIASWLGERNVCVEGVRKTAVGRRGSSKWFDAGVFPATSTLVASFIHDDLRVSRG